MKTKTATFKQVEMAICMTIEAHKGEYNYDFVKACLKYLDELIQRNREAQEVADAINELFKGSYFAELATDFTKGDHYDQE